MEIVVRIEAGDTLVAALRDFADALAFAEKLRFVSAREAREHRQAGLQPSGDAADPPAPAAAQEGVDPRMRGDDGLTGDDGNSSVPLVLDVAGFLGERDSSAVHAPVDAGGGNNVGLSPAPAAECDVSSLNLPPVVETPPAVFSVKERPKPGPVPGETVWTDARNELLAALRMLSEKFNDIVPILNRLPGPPVSSANATNVRFRLMKTRGTLPCMTKKKAEQIVARVMALEQAPAQKVVEVPAPAQVTPAPPATAKAMTADEVKARIAALPGAVVAKQAPPAAKPAPARVTMPKGAIRTTAVEIEQWAAQRGLCNGGASLDMVAINAKRGALGLAPFELVRGR